MRQADFVLMPKSFRLNIICYVTSLLAFLACLGNDASARNLDILTVCGTPNIAILVLIAQKEGFFKDEELEVEYQPLQNSKLAIDAVVSGQKDLGLVLDINVAYLGFAGVSDVRILGEIMKKSDDGIIARKDHGITTPGDLIGKRIAYFPAGTTYVLLHRLAKKNGIDLGKTILIPMSPPAMQAAIVNGDIDAASLFQPFRLNAAASLGARAVQFENDGLYQARVLVAARRDNMVRREGSINRFFIALDKAARFANSNKANSIALIYRELGVDKEALEKTWPSYEFGLENVDRLLTSELMGLGEWILTAQPEFKSRSVPSYEQFLQRRIPNALSAR